MINFIKTTSENLEKLTTSEGNIIVTPEDDNMYYDIGNSRYSITESFSWGTFSDNLEYIFKTGSGLNPKVSLEKAGDTRNIAYTVTNDSINFTLTRFTSDTAICAICTAELIDVTDMQAISFTFYRNYSGTEGNGDTIKVGLILDKDNASYNNRWFYDESKDVTSNDPITITCDVSKATGSYYVGIQTRTVYSTFAMKYCITDWSFTY